MARLRKPVIGDWVAGVQQRELVGGDDPALPVESGLQQALPEKDFSDLENYFREYELQ